MKTTDWSWRNRLFSDMDLDDGDTVSEVPRMYIPSRHGCKPCLTLWHDGHTWMEIQYQKENRNWTVRDCYMYMWKSIPVQLLSSCSKYMYPRCSLHWRWSSDQLMMPCYWVSISRLEVIGYTVSRAKYTCKVNWLVNDGTGSQSHDGGRVHAWGAGGAGKKYDSKEVKTLVQLFRGSLANSPNI